MLPVQEQRMDPLLNHLVNPWQWNQMTLKIVGSGSLDSVSVDCWLGAVVLVVGYR